MPDNSKQNTTFHGRLFSAWNAWEGRHGRKLTQTEMTGMVGKLRGDPLSQGTVNDWLKGRYIPSLSDVLYLARVFSCDPGWLAYGSDSAAPGLDNPIIRGIRPAPRPKPR